MNNSQFTYKSLPYQVHFGEGKSSKISKLIPSGSGVFVIADARNQHIYEALVSDLGKDRITLYSEVTQHVPEELARRAAEAYQDSGASFIVAIGGGSTIGLAKAIALKEDTSIIAVPTTYSGSEMTNIYGITGSDGHKTTGRDDRVMASHIIYDPQLTQSLPVKLAVTSAVNAMAHLIEAIYASDGNPVTYVNSVYGLKQLVIGFHILSKEKRLTPGCNLLFCEAAFLAGKGLSEVSMSLHHKAAHVLGGTFGLEHSHVHTVLLPFVLEFQWTKLRNKVKEDIKKSMMHPYPPAAIMDIIRLMEAPSSLKEIGFEESQIPEAVEQMLKNPYNNPRELDQEGLTRLLSQAYAGQLIGDQVNA